MKVWLPWDDDNPYAADLDFDDEEEQVESVPPSQNPDEPKLSVREIVELGQGVVSQHQVRRAIARGIFPNASKERAPLSRGPAAWVVPKSEAVAWLEWMSDG